MRPRAHPPGDFPTHPAGLRGAGKVLGRRGSDVAQRRVPTFAAAGADAHPVPPMFTPALETVLITPGRLGKAVTAGDVSPPAILLVGAVRGGHRGHSG